MIDYDDFKEDVLSAMKNKQEDWRDGQFVFNYINEKYGVARYVQFIEGIDCFHRDDKIDQFIDKCYATMVSVEQNAIEFE